MGTEDTLNGATAAMTLFNAYMGTVAEEIGMDRATGLFTKMCESKKKSIRSHIRSNQAWRNGGNHQCQKRR